MKIETLNIVTNNTTNFKSKISNPYFHLATDFT